MIMTKHGMSMIEVIVTIAVFAIIALPLSQAISQGATASIITRDRDQALILAESKIEELRSMGFHNPALISGVDTSEIGFEVSWTVAPVSGSLKRVIVDVTDSNSGSPVQLETILGVLE